MGMSIYRVHHMWCTRKRRLGEVTSKFLGFPQGRKKDHAIAKPAVHFSSWMISRPAQQQKKL